MNAIFWIQYNLFVCFFPLSNQPSVCSGNVSSPSTVGSSLHLNPWASAFGYGNCKPIGNYPQFSLFCLMNLIELNKFLFCTLSLFDYLCYLFDFFPCKSLWKLLVVKQYINIVHHHHQLCMRKELQEHLPLGYQYYHWCHSLPHPLEKLMEL